LIEVSDTIKREEIAAAKYDNVDVIYVSRETFKGVADAMKQFNVKWRSINMLFHGSANLAENSVDMFGIKMSMNPTLMAKDPNVVDFIAFTKDVCKYTDDSLYIYTCAVGLADGFKSLCLQMDVKLVNGIYLSTNITGNGAGQDWDVEWGTKTGFLTVGVHTNEIEHAQICLFKEIKLLTFVLMSSDTDIAVGRAKAADAAAALEVAAVSAAAGAEAEKEALLIKNANVAALRRVPAANLILSGIGTNAINGHWDWLLYSQIYAMPEGLLTKMDITLLSISQARDGLIASRMPYLSDTQISQLQSKHLSGFTPAQVWALGERVPLVLKNLPGAQVKMLSARQIRWLTPENLNLADFRLDSLTDNQIKILNHAQIKGLAVGKLTPYQISAFDPDQFCAFSKPQLGALDPFQIRGITGAQLICVNRAPDSDPYNALVLICNRNINTFLPPIRAVFISLGERLSPLTTQEEDFFGWLVSRTVPPPSCYKYMRSDHFQAFDVDLDHVGAISQVCVEANFNTWPGSILNALSLPQMEGLTESFLKNVISRDAIHRLDKLSLGKVSGSFFYYIPIGSLNVEQEGWLTVEQTNAYKTNLLFTR